MNRFSATVLAALTAAALGAADGVDGLRRENRRLREQVIRLEQELAALRLWLGSVSLSPEVGHPAREKRALQALAEFSRRGGQLIVAAGTAGEEFRKLLDEVSLGPARKARLQLRLDALDEAARKFAALRTSGADQVGSCQVLAVDRTLRAVVLSAGSGGGVMPGMVFHASGDPMLRLRVIAVRYDGALAEPMEGTSLDRIVPGSRFSALNVKK